MSITLLTTKVEPFTLIISPSLGLRPFTSHLRSGTVNGVLDKAEGIEEDDEEEDDEEFDVYAAAADTAVYALADAAAAAAEASSDDDEKCLVVECATGVEISVSFFHL